MKGLLQYWWGRSLALTVLLGSSMSTIALPSAAQSPNVLPVLVPEVPIAMQNPLEQTVWHLVSYRNGNGDMIRAWGDPPTIFQFASGRVTFATGCNRFFSSGYTVTGEELTLSTGHSPLIACLSDMLAHQELAIVAGMATVRSYDLASDELQLLNRDGDVVFILKAQTLATLTNTAWTLIGYNNGQGDLVSPLPDTTLTATFDDAGGLAGSAGCNNYRANFEQADNTLQIGTAASTRRLCPAPDGTMQQEQVFLGLLAEVSTYDIDGNQLTLKDAAGNVLAQFAT
ncbi:MAG: META domain-containing protein [Leptolyngbya sp. SIOISBB]|nr:META domain-containing protein [Leptolyngbya sp. SIOISBB]